MCLKLYRATRTMIIVTILVLVSVVGADVNITEVTRGQSRMAWLRTLMDHHDWQAYVDKEGIALPPQCKDDLKSYFAALNDGKVWASKMYDASGQYNQNVMFGNEYWLGSLSSCRDLHLKQYYASTPPFDTKFHMVRINVTLDEDHLPQSRVILVGECLPASCNESAILAIMSEAEAAASARAAAAGLPSAVRTVGVRPVPSSYNILHDTKLHILGTVSIIVLLLMVTASCYEGYLERRFKHSTDPSDLELAQHDNNNKPVSDGTHQADGNSTKDNQDRDLRRETCGTWAEVLLSFSMLSNGRAILSTHRPTDGALTSLHGIRFLSVVWVIMVHTYLTVFYISTNKTMRTIIERNFMYQSVGNASYCVDSFFFISGLLVTVLFLRTEDKKAVKREEVKQQKDKQHINKNMNGYTNSALSVSVISQSSFCQDLLEKPKGKLYTRGEFFSLIKNFVVLFFYRVVRLSPAYAFVIGLNEITLRYTNSHSVFEPAQYDHVTCDQFWWRNLLYINNLYSQREMCMVWSWYMANDMQFYVVGIILLLISVKHPKFAVGLLGVIMVSSWATTIYISVSSMYKARIQEPFEMFDGLYDKPWSRIGPYLVGMIVGWYLHKTKCQVKMPYWLVAVGWPVSLAIIGSLIFGMVDGYFEVWPTAFYVSVGHTAWGVALAWVSIACCCGYGGLVNSVLSYRGLLPLSRLTYCAYLVHPTIMMYTCFLLDGPFHLQNSMVIISYSGYAVMAFVTSFVISLAFEAPVVRLLKIVSGGHRKSKSH
ncbi:nose resistant to fluoxetine protein 6-like [Cydia amplana]|uniref:nose resistant to fluoxetine protein 6-like n=1 Tax=Cydia amplana TaxID=1869771 RepID=UPI002FE67865